MQAAGYICLLMLIVGLTKSLEPVHAALLMLDLYLPLIGISHQKYLEFRKIAHFFVNLLITSLLL